MFLAFLHKQYPELDRIANDIKKKHDFASIKDQTFKDLKQAWCAIREFLLSDPIPSENMQRDFMRKILGDEDDGKDWTVVTRGNKNTPGFWQRFKSAIGADHSPEHSSYENRRGSDLPDPEFVALLQPLQSMYPVVAELTARITNCHEVYLAKAGNKLVKPYMDKVIDTERTRRVRVCSQLRSERMLAEARAAVSTLRDQLKSAMPSGTP